MKPRKHLIWMVLALALAAFAVGCSFSVSTAKIQDAIMTTSIDAEGKPGDAVTSYPADAEMLYTSAKIRNAPDNTKIRIVWTYVTGDQLIDSIDLDSGDISDRYIYSNFAPSAALPAGDYKVEYYVEDRKEPDATVLFSVAEGAMKAEDTMLAYLEDTHMTSGADATGVPVDTITQLPTTGTWYVSSILRNTQADTRIHYTWYDATGNVIDSFDLNPEGATDVYIFGSFELSSAAPEGQYRVEITINDETQPAAAVDFTVSANPVNDPSSAAGYSVYSQKEGGYSFQYPTVWMLQEFPKDMAVWVYPHEASIKGEDDLNTVYVFADKGKASSYTIDTLLQTWVDETAGEGIESYQYIAQSVDTINGKDIASFSYSWTRGSYQLYTVDALILDGADFFVLSLTVTQDQYDAIYPMFEQMAISFEVLK